MVYLFANTSDAVLITQDKLNEVKVHYNTHCVIFTSDIISTNEQMLFRLKQYYGKEFKLVPDEEVLEARHRYYTEK